MTLRTADVLADGGAGCPLITGSILAPTPLALRNLSALADAHRLDAVVAHRLHADRVAVGGDRVPALGQASELGEHEAADGVVGVAVHGQVQAVVGEVGDRDVAAHEPVAVGQSADLAGGGIGLVGDLPHYLLDDVLHRDHARHAPVLVHDHGHRGALTLHGG